MTVVVCEQTFVILKSKPKKLIHYYKWISGSRFH